MTLRVDNLFKRFGNNWVWRDVSFEALRGEVLAIFGPMGSGKSTLLKVLAGLEDSNGGSIFLDDQDVTKLHSATRGISYFGDKNDRRWSLFSRSRKWFDDEEAIKTALNSSARVLMLDQPFCRNDGRDHVEFEKVLRTAVRERDLTVILATADYDTVFDLCDRVGVLVDGDIRQIGTPQEVYDRPCSRAVAAIVGRNNIFDSRRLTSSRSDHPEFITLIGEHRLFAEKADVKTLGPINKNVSLAIRPENISISFGASFPEDNLLKAVVTGIRPRGASTIVDLDSNGLRLSAVVLRLVETDIGDECMIGLPPERIQILSD